jgi:hypothetical protein
MSALSCLLALCLVAACLVLVGCGAKETPDTKAPTTSAPKAASSRSGAGAVAASIGAASSVRPPQFTSFFSTTDPKDPFNPKSKPQPVTVTTTAPTAPTLGPKDIIAALEAGFRGTLGPPTERIALVHGTALEQNRETAVPITVLGAQRRVKVRPLRILRDTMEAQVEGIPDVVTLKVRR